MENAFDQSAIPQMPEQSPNETDPCAIIRREKKRFSALGFGITALVIGMQFLYLIPIYIVSAVAPKIYESFWFTQSAAYLCLYGIALPVMLLLLRKHKKDPFTPKSFSLPKWLLALAICMGATLLGSLLAQLVMFIPEQIAGVNDPLNNFMQKTPLWFTGLFTLVFAPIGEEFIFRKLIIDRLRRYGTIISVLVSAALFSLFHMNIYQMIYAFFVGCILGYIYEKTGRLRYTISLHFAINFLGGVFPIWLQELMGNIANFDGPLSMLRVTQLQGWLLSTLLVLFEFACMAGFLLYIGYFFWKKRSLLSKSTISLTFGQKADIIFLNPGMIIAGVTMLGILFLTTVSMFFQ